MEAQRQNTMKEQRKTAAMFGLENENQDENDEEQKLLDKKQSNIVQSPSMVMHHVRTDLVEDTHLDHKKIVVSL